MNKEEDNIEEFTKQLEVVHIESDTEEDEDFGYHQLPQDEDEGWELIDSDEEETSEPMKIELDPSQKIDSETCDLIRSIMSKVELSEKAVPDWAKHIPESSWMPRTQKEE